jgi:hypothetical protein
MLDDPQLLDDLIAKLGEMQEQLSMAELEAGSHNLLRGRIRHLYILATFVRTRLQGVRQSGNLPPKTEDETKPDSRA